MSITESLDLKIKSFKASSSFTPGDQFSFSISLGKDSKLPGRYDPDSYIQRLAADVKDKKVLVVCPGNGGLCVAAIQAGASSVSALEPRVIYSRALNIVSGLTQEAGRDTFTCLSDIKAEDRFDVIFWAEGLEEIQHPKVLFERVVRSLANDGVFYVEVTHGNHGKLPESINSWRPTLDAFMKTMDDYNRLLVVGKMGGRNQLRSIYTIKSALGTASSTSENTTEAAPALQQLEAESTSTPTPPATTEDGDVSVAAQLAARIQQIIRTEEPYEGDLDSIYEGRVSTPKSNESKDDLDTEDGRKGRRKRK